MRLNSEEVLFGSMIINEDSEPSMKGAIAMVNEMKELDKNSNKPISGIGSTIALRARETSIK